MPDRMCHFSLRTSRFDWAIQFWNDIVEPSKVGWRHLPVSYENIWVSIVMRFIEVLSFLFKGSQNVQKLISLDCTQLGDFCKCLICEQLSLTNLHRKILFSEEVMFYLNDHANECCSCLRIITLRSCILWNPFRSSGSTTFSKTISLICI